MNKIYKVMYSKVKQCAVVVSEIAKSHGHHEGRSAVRKHTALTAAVLVALGMFSFLGMPSVAQAADGTESMKNNDYVGANGYYWYFDEKTNQWTKYPYKISSINNNRSWQKLPNYEGGGAKEPGAVTAGLYAQAGEQTVTIGNRNAGQSKGSVFIGELDGYNDGGENDPVGMRNNYVTAVGFQSNATGWGSIAIGSNAVAENTKETSQVVDYEGSAGTSGTVQDDNYGIKLNPSIKWSSVALGYSAKAKDGNIAIGAYSDATDTSSATPYVSVGNTTIKRRITNVADGTETTDVATVGQMNKAIESVGATGWTLSTNGSTSGTTIKSGTKVDFSPAVDGKNGTAGHSNVTVSNTGSNVKIGLNKDIVLGETTKDNGGSLNVYSDSSDSNNLSNHVKITGSTISVNYPKTNTDGTTTDTRGVIIGVGEDSKGNADGYIAFNNATGAHTYLHSATDAPKDLQDRLEYKWNDVQKKSTQKKYIANLDDGITFTGDVNGKVPEGYTQTPTKLNTTLNIMGGAKTTDDLTSGNIGVVSTPAAEKEDGTTQASKLEIKLNKDLKGITSITSSTTNSTGAKIELGENGTTISGGDVNVSGSKVTGLKDGENETDAVTVKQLNEAKTALTVKPGWGIEKTDDNTISVKHNLGKNYGNRFGEKGKVTFEADGENALILGGGAITSGDKDVSYGAHAKDSVLLGGMNNTIEKDSEGAIIIGGRWNTASSTGEVQQTGTDTVIVGGSGNKAEGDSSILIGGNNNEATGLNATIIGGSNNKNDGWDASIWGGYDNQITGIAQASGIFGGSNNKVVNNGFTYILGGENNSADGGLAVIVGGGSNKSSGLGSSVFGGADNTATGESSSIIGGLYNAATNYGDVISGGFGNLTSGEYAYAAGGTQNYVTNTKASSFGGMYSSVNGAFSTGVAGGSTGQEAFFSLSAGYQSVVTDGGVEKTYLTGEDANKVLNDMYSGKKLSGYYISDPSVESGPDNPGRLIHYDKFSTALGYQATADKAGTIAFGHDAGDESGYTYEWEQLPKDKDGYQTYANDGTTNDYTKPPKSVKKKAPYTSAYYNRLVKIADGKDAHDAVTVEQLNKVQNDLDTSKTHFYNVNSKDTEAGNYNNDGAKGAGSMAAGFSTHADGIASTVTGSYSGVINSGTAQGLDLRGAAALSYGTVNVNQNTDPTKAYSGVANSIVGQANMTTNSNAAIIYGAGNTVTDSYRPIDKEKAKAILGSTSDPEALSKAMQDAVKDSGGQVMVMGGGNVVDNAYMSQVTGVGNTVKGNQVYTKDAKTGEWNWTTDTNEKTAIKDYDSEKSSQYNYVDGFSNEVINGKHDYVIGANNKLSGDSYDDSKAQPIKRSNRSNIVIGDNHTLTREQNTVIIGSSDTENTQTKARDAVIIGHNANATNDDTGADNAVAIGRSAKATGGNAVTIGVNTSAGAESITIGSESSADSGSNIAIGRSVQVYGYKITNAVALGVNTKALVSDGVAIGSESQATVKGNSAEGYDPVTGKDSTDKTATWKATKAAVSIGTADGKVTRQINGLAAGTNDTDAVNVAQLKSLQSGLTEDLTGKGLKFAANSGTEYTAKLGSTVKIQGMKKKDGHEYTADNLTTEIDGSGNITILMDKDMSTETLAVNGKDGKNGQPGTAGSIGINGQNGQSGVGIDGKDGISIKGRDGKDGVTIKAVDGQNGTEGHIGLTGPAGTNGKDGTNAIDITVKNGYDGANGINGKNGVDGTSLTRIVYTDNTGEHQVATMEDGLKFKGDGDTVIKKKLNNTMEIIGGAKGDLTEGNIGVNSTTDGKLKVQLAKDLTGITSIGNQTTGAKIIFGSDGKTTITGGDVDVNGGKITNVGSGIKKDANGKYTVTDQNKGNAANIGDVQNMVNDAVNSATDTTNKALAGKANIDASNIGANLKGADGKAASTEKQKTNAENWGSAIGTGKIEANDGRMVTGETVYDEVRPKEDGNYVKKDKTTGDNLSALDSKIGKLDETKTYNYIDSKSTTSISDNLGKLDTQVKTNAENIENNTKSIQNITNNVKNLSDNAVQYDKDTNKTKVTLGGEGGTTITNVKDGKLSDDSTEAVNGRQLNAVQKQVTNNTTEITKIENGEGFTDAGKTVIKNWAKDAVQVKAGDRIKVDEATDKKTGNKTYTISANNNGTVAKNDGNLISGDTLYKEVHVDKDGSYIKGSNTVAQNLSALDSGLKATSDLINTNGDTIQIGGSSTATKIDVHGKDGKGNTTGRVITGVVTDDGDPTSAANVGYVNGVTAANTQQIYRDMNNAYGRLNNNINKAAAGSNALAALHPLDYDPDDKADFAVGYGHYRNANAAAVGAFYHPNENTMVNVGVSLGNGDPGFNAGVSFKIGSGSAGREAMSKTEMAKVINSQSKEIDALKKDNADKDKRIDALEQKMAEILAKLDKNGK